MEHRLVAVNSDLIRPEIKRLGLSDAESHQALVLSLPNLQRDTLRSTVDYLASNPQLVIDPARPTFANPLLFELPDNTLTPKRAFWTLVCHQLSRPVESIGNYVRSVLQIVDGRLPSDGDMSVVCDDAVYSLIDTRIGWVRNIESSVPVDELHEIADLFFDWLNRCDLGHEVRQDEYIKRLADQLMPNEQFQRLAAFRLDHGQYDVDYDHALHRQWLHSGLLRSVVDEELAHLRGELGPLRYGCDACLASDAEDFCWFVSSLLDLAYGDATSARADVQRYILANGGPDLGESEAALPGYLRESANERRAWADARTPLEDATTGFHEWTSSMGAWRKLA